MPSTVIGAIVGVLVAIPLTIVPVRKFLKPKTEQAFFSLTLIPIALFYIAFCFYYGDSPALWAETIGVMIFSILALWAHFSAAWILIFAYMAHGLWDVLHEVSLAGIGEGIIWTQVPPGYAAFCLVYDVIIAVYVYKRLEIWAGERAHRP